MHKKHPFSGLIDIAVGFVFVDTKLNPSMQSIAQGSHRCGCTLQKRMSQCLGRSRCLGTARWATSECSSPAVSRPGTLRLGARGQRQESHCANAAGYHRECLRHHPGHAIVDDQDGYGRFNSGETTDGILGYARFEAKDKVEELLENFATARGL